MAMPSWTAGVIQIIPALVVIDTLEQGYVTNPMRRTPGVLLMRVIINAAPTRGPDVTVVNVLPPLRDLDLQRVERIGGTQMDHVALDAQCFAVLVVAVDIPHPV